MGRSPAKTWAVPSRSVRRGPDGREAGGTRPAAAPLRVADAADRAGRPEVAAGAWARAGGRRGARLRQEEGAAVSLPSRGKPRCGEARRDGARRPPGSFPNFLAHTQALLCSEMLRASLSAGTLLRRELTTRGLQLLRSRHVPGSR